MASQLDFFAGPVSKVPPKQAKAEIVTHDRVTDDDEALARHLEERWLGKSAQRG